MLNIMRKMMQAISVMMDDGVAMKMTSASDTSIPVQTRPDRWAYFSGDEKKQVSIIHVFTF